MGIINKLNNFKVDWIDVVLIKIGVFVATLLLIKLWNPILSFGWYWYLIIWVIVAIRPMKTYYKWLISK